MAIIENIKIRLCSLSREYLYCIITHDILNNIQLNINKDIINNRIQSFLSIINRLYLNHNYHEISSLEELIETLKNTKEIYFKYYHQYLEGSTNNLEINKLKIPFIDIDSIIHNIKEMLNNNSYFCIIIDYQNPISNTSIQAINSLINSRNNANISMKVAVKPNEWPTYYDLNGGYIENIHDYSELELDKVLRRK